MDQRKPAEAEGLWRQEGFEDLSRGTCGNAGHNLYVSRAGVLQRIHRYDLDGDGYFDLVVCNSQDHWERPPAYVYEDPLGECRLIELPADGARAGAVADLNGDGCDDLVLGMFYNGIRMDLNAAVYYSSPEGLSEKHQQQLPVPACTSVAAGDFSGDGRPDLAFLSSGKVRLFYQTELLFEAKRYVDLGIEGEQLAAGDLDGDGCADLVVRSSDGGVRVYWGGPEGIHPERVSLVPVDPFAAAASESDPQSEYPEFAGDVTPLVKVVSLEGAPHVFVARPDSVYLVPAAPSRTFGPPLVFACERALSVAAGDVNGDGRDDLVFACRQPDGDGEVSWVYWGSDAGFSEARRARLATDRACDVAVGDLDADGCADTVFCQSGTDTSFTRDSLVYRGSPGGVAGEPLPLETHDARRVFLLRSPDGKPKVAFVNCFSRRVCGDVDVSVYLGGPDGFTAERRLGLPAQGAVEALCVDLNDDGRTDVVVVNCSENAVSLDPGSFVYFNGPQGFARAPDLRLPTTRAHGACCADLNRDGYLDLIFCGFDNPELLILYGQPGGFDTERPVRVRMERDGEVFKDPRWISLADLNNDGWLDLVVPQISSDRSFILWGGPEGFSMERCQMLSVFHGACARAADLNGNGTLDLIIGGHAPSLDGPHDSFVTVYWNGPEGLREDRKTLLPANAVNAMCLADFDGDGSLDLFVCSYHDGRSRDIDSYLYWNRPGRGSSAADRQRLFTHSASGCVAADFNGDGWMDLAVAYHKVDGDHLGYSEVWWGGPDGFSEGRTTRLPSAGPHGLTAAEPGNLRDRGAEEYYTSVPYELPAGADVTHVSWEGEVPPHTWARAQLRFAETPELLAGATWQGADGGTGWLENGQPAGRLRQAGPWVQYRLALGARNAVSSPRVTAVNVGHRRARSSSSDTACR